MHHAATFQIEFSIGIADLRTVLLALEGRGDVQFGFGVLTCARSIRKCKAVC